MLLESYDSVSSSLPTPWTHEKPRREPKMSVQWASPFFCACVPAESVRVHIGSADCMLSGACLQHLHVFAPLGQHGPCFAQALDMLRHRLLAKFEYNPISTGNAAPSICKREATSCSAGVHVHGKVRARAYTWRKLGPGAQRLRSGDAPAAPGKV